MREDPEVREKEVRETARRDRERVCEEDRCAGSVDEERHEREVSEEGEETVGCVEAEQCRERVAA